MIQQTYRRIDHSSIGLPNDRRSRRPRQNGAVTGERAATASWLIILATHQLLGGAPRDPGVPSGRVWMKSTNRASWSRRLSHPSKSVGTAARSA